eukprot:4482448-Prymnesium_polylepis.1
MFDVPKGVDGPDTADFPKGLAEAPVTWDYHGSEMKLKFKAGFIGATQDEQTKVVRPKVGWFIVGAAGVDAGGGEDVAGVPLPASSSSRAPRSDAPNN